MSAFLTSHLQTNQNNLLRNIQYIYVFELFVICSLGFELFTLIRLTSLQKMSFDEGRLEFFSCI